MHDRITVIVSYNADDKYLVTRRVIFKYSFTSRLFLLRWFADPIVKAIFLREGYEKGHPLLLDSLHKLGLCERELQNFSESEMHLKEAYSQATKAELAIATDVLEDMIVLYQKWGRMDEVKRYTALKP